jgi:hypothetical protein
MALDVGPASHVGPAQFRAGRPGGAGGPQQPVVLVQAHGAALLGGGAPAAQRAIAAGGPEEDSVVGGDPASDAGRAGHGLGGRIDGEVTVVEASLDWRPQRPGLITAWRPAAAIAARRSPVP